MLRSVELDDDLSRVPSEVGNITSDRRLPAKMHAERFHAAQKPPHFSFGIRRLASQRLGAAAYSWLDICSRHTYGPPYCPTPAPPHEGEGVKVTNVPAVSSVLQESILARKATDWAPPGRARRWRRRPSPWRVGQQVRIPGPCAHQLDGLLGAVAARRALAAALVLEEAASGSAPRPSYRPCRTG